MTESVPIITISVIDEQSTRQDELRELYLKWIQNQESRLQGEERKPSDYPQGREFTFIA